MTTLIADNTGPFRTFGSGLPAINDAGTVAFLASLDEGGSGIFTGPNPVTDTELQSNVEFNEPQRHGER